MGTTNAASPPVGGSLGASHQQFENAQPTITATTMGQPLQPGAYSAATPHTQSFCAAIGMSKVLIINKTNVYQIR